MPNANMLCVAMPSVFMLYPVMPVVIMARGALESVIVMKVVGPPAIVVVQCLLALSFKLSH
jgi:hypothetical protein